MFLLANTVQAADITNGSLVELKDFGRMARYDKTTDAPATGATPEDRISFRVVEKTSEIPAARPGDAFGIFWQVSRPGDYTLVLIDPLGERVIKQSYQPKITYQQTIQVCSGTRPGLHAFEIRYQGKVQLRKEFHLTLAR
ncbi:MAG: hypothetical protein L3J03_03755 [Desulfobacterales bacterium]|nr:hypothetical protein [Desulfobacterales bacterium]